MPGASAFSDEQDTSLPTRQSDGGGDAVQQRHEYSAVSAS